MKLYKAGNFALVVCLGLTLNLSAMFDPKPLGRSRHSSIDRENFLTRSPKFRAVIDRPEVDPRFISNAMSALGLGVGIAGCWLTYKLTEKVRRHYASNKYLSYALQAVGYTASICAAIALSNYGYGDYCGTTSPLNVYVDNAYLIVSRIMGWTRGISYKLVT